MTTRSERSTDRRCRGRSATLAAMLGACVLIVIAGCGSSSPGAGSAKDIAAATTSAVATPTPSPTPTPAAPSSIAASPVTPSITFGPVPAAPPACVSAICPTANPNTIKFPITDSNNTAGALQLFGSTGLYIDPSGLPQLWVQSVPVASFGPAAVDATPTKISGLTFVLSKTKNVLYLAYAVLDTKGACAGGVMETKDAKVISSSKKVLLAADTKCNGAAVGVLAGY
jgi:hypothetical protein